MNPTGVSLQQLLLALQRKGIPLQFEMGAFVVLEATEKVVALQAAQRGRHAPALVTAENIWLSDEGELALGEVQPAATEAEACRALVELLGALLVRSAPGVPPMLLDLVEHGPSDGEWSLHRLRDDLEASLLPLNRGATRRVLSRLLRETRRDVERGRSPPPPDAHSIDRALDDLLGFEGDPDAPAAGAGGAGGGHSAEPAVSDAHAHGRAEREPPRLEHDASAAYASPPPPRVPPRIPSLRGSAAERAASSLPSAAPGDDARVRPGNAAGPPSPRSARAPALGELQTLSGEPSPRLGLDEFEHEAARVRGGRGMQIALALLTVTGLLIAGYFALGRGRVRERLGFSQAEKAAANAPAPVAAGAPAASNEHYGELRVTSAPARAQVLMLVGNGPVVVPDLPVGVAHEFVAMADGLSPARGLVPPGAAWAKQPDGTRRYELAIQLGDASARSFDLGETRMPQDPGTASGELGGVRVVTSPPGARVYQLIGFTPDVRVQNLPVETPVELLLYEKGYAVTHASVGPGDFKQEDSGLVAELDVSLTKKH